MKNLLLIILYIYIFKYNIINGQILPNYGRRRSSSSDSSQDNILLDSTPPELVDIKVRPVTLYSCGAQVFMSYPDARTYCNKLTKSRIRNPLDMAKGSLTLNYKEILKASGLRSVDFSLLLTSNPYSNNIWKAFWSGFTVIGPYTYDYHSEFKKRLLKEINHYRYFHGGFPLKYAKKLEHYARLTVMDMIKNNSTVTDKDRLFGETCARLDFRLVPLVGKLWYDRGIFYNYTKQNTYPEVSAFTQLVWKSTTKIGCWMEKTQSIVYICCKFFPSGNVKGAYGENVNPPK